MTFNKQFIKNIKLHYKVLSGNHGKRYYVLSKDFWNFIQEELKEIVDSFDNSENLKSVVRFIGGRLGKF